MINSSALLTDLKAQLKALRADLTERAEDRTNPWGARLRAEHADARDHRRTARTWSVWREDEVEQAAVAWLVATAFLRFCEDNDLLAGARADGEPVPVGWIVAPASLVARDGVRADDDLAGLGDVRVARAEEHVTAYFRANPMHNRRHWIQQGLRVLADQPAGKALVDPAHHPVWTAEISPEAATALLQFWRRTDPAGNLVHDFRDPELGTRFLGDLYQELSEHAKSTYALLQTPEFVEELILDRTLTPALRETSLGDLRLIDPTCGSGHFLLGAFDRLIRAWAAEAPGLDVKERVRRAMDAVHGVDINPFAVAIARFRLTVAGLRAMGETSLVGVPELGYHLAIGDSLLGEQGRQGSTDELVGDWHEGQLDLGDTLTGPFDEDPAGNVGSDGFAYSNEDLAEYHGILQPGRYHVVVGNPPYITVKDKALNKAYRDAYKTAHRQYALSVPFMELFFRLAIRGEQGRPAGHVGQITANSFMKREFGTKLVEEFFAGYYAKDGRPVDLTQVVDTSGAFIPGHGTPTVIIIGRTRHRVSDTVRAVLGARGEPGQPENPAKGRVWTEIVEHIDDEEYEGTYVTVTSLKREVLTEHPLSLSAGRFVKEAIDEGGAAPLSESITEIGFGGVTREDEAYMVGAGALRRHGVLDTHRKLLVEGEFLRDFGGSGDALESSWPYDPGTLTACADEATLRLLWPLRTRLKSRVAYGKSQLERGLMWFEYSMFFERRYRIPLSIAFAFVATHNHFVLDRGGKVFNRSAPVIKLPDGATEEQHLELLGVLNSSTACLWLKQVSHDKGSQSGTGGFMHDEWEVFYEFTGTKLNKFPLPAEFPLARALSLDALAQQLASTAPRAVVGLWLADHAGPSLAAMLRDAERQWQGTRAAMIWQQEELDWEVYRLYGLTDEDLAAPSTEPGTLALGERAFEIVLAREVAAGTEETVWFKRHSSMPVTEIPERFTPAHRARMEHRLHLIEQDPTIRLLERPENKRRWATEPWAKLQNAALREAILDRLEEPGLWQDEQGPVTRSVAELAGLLRNDQVLREMCRALSGLADPDLASVLGLLAADEAVPFLAAYRYKPSGLEKFREWQQVWDIQRREDAGEKVVIETPPRYVTGDFRKNAYWSARGTLDMPKERFILYPETDHDGDASPVLGWAGWNHRDQALALAREAHLQQDRGITEEALVPLVAGLVELEPWLRQWHGEIEAEFGLSAADVIEQEVDGHLVGLGMTRDQVTAWVPAARKRGRKAAS
ncbi:BREX-2 system adenine-specific DNA-methyltransferase PglX [Promicromonospora sp. NPDC050262]|uniref:BREX-2 system adenine-specific DNA-methyltransferase PglX n=1 Tax=Promicromonospora sp. NPDC050262 TaxID=3155036 RepID=UPI003408B0AB